MKEDKINIEIAEACGWTEIREQDYELHDGEVRQYWSGNPPEGYYPFERLNPPEIPDYCNDLNAMHEAEESLSGPTWTKYVDHVRKMTLNDAKDGTDLCERLIRATAAQRASAFIAAIQSNDKVSDGGPLTHESKQDANPPFAAPLG